MAYARSCADPHRTAEVAAACVRSAPRSFPEDLARTFVDSQSIVQSQTTDQPDVVVAAVLEAIETARAAGGR